MATIVSIQQGGTGANNVSDAINALGVLANTGGSFTGEVKFTGPNTSINVSNNAIISGNVTIEKNTSISGNITIDGRGLFGDGIEEHFTSKDIDSSTITVAGFANNNGASEIMVINKSNGALSYAEFIALNDKANQEQGWISVGVNSSEYNDPSYTLTGPDDGYILFEAPLNSNNNGDLIIGTGSNGQNNHIVLAAGGFAPTDAQMIISPADVKEATITNSELTSNVALIRTLETHTFIANDIIVVASVGAPYDGQFTVTTVSSNTITYSIPNGGTIGSAAANGTVTQILPFNKGTVQLTAQLFVGENSKSTIETADITLAQGHAIPLGIVVDNDGPGQTVMFNKSNGTLAYSEFIAHNDAGNVEAGWVSVGINSSGYDDPEFPITKADDAYLLYEPPANTTGDGDLIIGTGTNGQKNRLIFAAQGFDEANAQMIITPDESVRISINADSSSANTGALQVVGGIGVQGSVFVQGNQTIQGDLIVNGSQVIQSIENLAAAGPISLVGDGNIANTWDFGIVGTYAKTRESLTRTITNKELANNIATLTTSINHSFIVEDYATVANVDSTFNGTHRITAVTSNTFSYFKLANNITSTAATGNVSVSSRATYTGVVKDTANATWKLLSNIERRPDFNANLTNTVLDSIQVATINASSFVTSAGLNVTNQANNAYATANAAYDQANAAYGQANSAYGAANNRVLKSGDTMTGNLTLSSASITLSESSTNQRLIDAGTTLDSGRHVAFPLRYFIGSASTGAPFAGYNAIPRANGAYSYSTSDAVWGINYGGSNRMGFYYAASGTAGANISFSELMTIASTGNVGIGITNPSHKLDVNGTSIFRDTLNFGSGAIISWTSGYSDGTTQTFQSPTNGSLALVANNSLALFVKSNQYVGIGTSSPTTRLDVRADNTIALFKSSAAGFAKINVEDSSGTYNTVLLADSGITAGAVGTQSNHDFVFRTNNTEKMRITTGGNVGIGTTNPSVKLHVAGSSIIANNTSIDPDSYPNQVFAGAISDTLWGVTSAIGGNAGTGHTWAIGHNGSALYFGIGDGTNTNSLTTYMSVSPNKNIAMVQDGGNVGIGTATPLNDLHVWSSATTGYVRIGGDNGAGQSRVFIEANGDNSYIDSYGNNAHKPLTIAANPLILNNGTGGGVRIGTTTDPTSGGFTNTTLSIKQIANGATGGGIHIESQSDQSVAYFGFGSGAFRIGTSYRTTGSHLPIQFTPGNSGTSLFLGTDGNVGIGSTSPLYKLDVNGPISMPYQGYLMGQSYFERLLGDVAFPNDVANLAFDIILGNLSFWGYIEVEINSTYNFQNSTGKLTKIFAVGTNPNGSIYTNESRIVDALGTIDENIAIGEFSWDSTNSRFRIPISHIVTTANTFTVKVRMFSQGNSSSGGRAVFDAITLSSQYTLTALTQQYPSYADRLGIRTQAAATPLNINIGNGGGTGGTFALRVGGTENYPSLELGIYGAYDGMITSYGNDIRYYSGHWRTIGNVSSESHSHYWFTSRAGSADWSNVKMQLNENGDLIVGNGWAYGNLQLSGTLSGYGAREYPALKTSGPCLHFDAQGTYTGYICYNGGFTDVSDARLKTNVTPLSNALNTVVNLQGVRYAWKDGRDDFQEHVGFIAQQVQEVLPEAVSDPHPHDAEVAMLGIKSPAIVAVLVEAVKEQQAIIESLKSRIEALENK